MPVYVYSDSWKTDCIGVLEDNGYFFDRKENLLDSSHRMSHFLGSVSSNGSVYSDPQGLHKIGVIDDYGKIYRGWNILTNIPTETAPLGCYEGDKVYKGNSSWGEYPVAYLDGDGDYRAAAAAVILFVICPLGDGDEDDYAPPEESYGGGGYYSGGGYSATSCSEAFLPIIAVIAAIVGIVYSLMWIDGCSEKLEDDFEKENGSRVEEKQPASSVSSDPEGWMLLDDHSGRYRASFMNENANDTFTFTYTAGGDSTVSFEVDPDYRELKLSSYIIYNGQEYNIRTKLDVRAGDQVVVIVEQRAGTGYFNIYAYEN